MEILHAKVLGEGFPLIILHGFLGMSDNWKTLGNQYANLGFQVHLIDQRNHGKSFHSEDFDYEYLADDIRTYMDHYQLSVANVLGHSMGGKTAMQFGLTYPERVQKLLVADIAPKYYPPHHQDIINALNALNLEHIQSRNEANTALGRYITEVGIRQFLLKNLYWETKDRLGFRFNLDVLSERMNEIGEAITPALSFVKPTLFLRGDRSEYILPQDFSDIKKQFPNAKLQSISKAGHWLHAENPRQFFEFTSKFLIS